MILSISWLHADVLPIDVNINNIYSIVYIVRSEISAYREEVNDFYFIK